MRDKGIDAQMNNCESQKCVQSITPTEFELLCKNILTGFAEEESLIDFCIDHNKVLSAPDGDYQIDVYASYTALGASMKVICECKQYSSAVKRDDVVLLHNRVIQLGCHKGILMATSDFQSGALKYAKQHGIALIKVYDYKNEFLSHSSGPVEIDEKDPFYQAEKIMPPYRAKSYLPSKEEPVLVFPTKRMIADIYNKQKQLIEEYMGISIDY